MTGELKDEAGALDKGKRLAQMMSLGCGYFKSKKALEEHDWDVDAAIESTIISSTIDKKPSATPANETAPASAVVPSFITHKDENPHLSPDHANVRSLKRQTPHSHKHFEKVPDAMPSSAVARMKTGGDSSPTTLASAKQDPPGHAIMDHEYKKGIDESTTQENIAEFIEKQVHAFPDDCVEEIGRNANVNRIASTPGAFREGGNDNSSEAWDSLIQGSTPSPPYLAVAETVSVPELVNATLQPPVMSAVTSPIELAQLPSEAGIASSDEEEDKSAVERSYRSPARRRSLQVIAVALLVFIGLVVGLAVSLTPNSSAADVSGRNDTTPTTSPTPMSPTLEPSTSAPSLATGDGAIQSPTTEPSQLPTDSPTLEPSASPTTPPTTQPTTPLPTLSPTRPPTQSPTTSRPAPPTTSRPTVPTDRPTDLPTDPPTVPVTESPTPSPTVGSTPPPTVSPTTPPTVSPTTREPTTPPTVSPTVEPTSPQPPQEDMRVERAEMVLSGASRLDGDARRVWADVTIDFLLDQVAQTLDEETNDSYEVNVRTTLDSQTETNDEELTLIFSVEFEIESSLESHNVEEYVLDAFNDKEAYIEELQDSDSSFDDVFDVNVSV